MNGMSSLISPDSSLHLLVRKRRTDVGDGRWRDSSLESRLFGGVVSPQPKPDTSGRISDLGGPFSPRPLPNSPELSNPVSHRRSRFLHLHLLLLLLSVKRLRNNPLLDGVNINSRFNINFVNISSHPPPLIQLFFITGRISSVRVRYRYPNLLRTGGPVHRPLPALGKHPRV
nr:hypothetical protein Iba_chr02bCG16020 [Ipomoea batatas]